MKYHRYETERVLQDTKPELTIKVVSKLFLE
jgi:hypothetical protein